MSQTPVMESHPEHVAPKRLYRSRSDRMVFGVCGGLGEYFEFDPVLFRLGFVLLGLTGTGILAYIIFAIVLPERPATEPEPTPRGLGGANRTPEIIGWALLAFGLLLLADNLGFLGFFRWHQLWPVLLIALGVALLLRRRDTA